MEAAGQVSLRYFRTPLLVDRKPDDSPVTRADREAESAIVEEIQRAFPSHGILAEERGAIAGDGANRWIVDPLDGTRGFTRGGIFWGPLVALEHRGEVVAGAMGLPALGEIWWAGRGTGCFRNGERVRAFLMDRIDRATLSLGELKSLLAPPHGEAVRGILRTCESARCYGDVASVAMLLEGRADVWIEAGVKPWDLAAPKILVEEAGGRFTDLSGGSSLDAGTALAASATLHDAILSLLAREERPPIRPRRDQT